MNGVRLVGQKARKRTDETAPVSHVTTSVSSAGELIHDSNHIKASEHVEVHFESLQIFLELQKLAEPQLLCATER